MPTTPVHLTDRVRDHLEVHRYVTRRFSVSVVRGGSERAVAPVTGERAQALVYARGVLAGDRAASAVVLRPSGTRYGLRVTAAGVEVVHGYGSHLTGLRAPEYLGVSA